MYEACLLHMRTERVLKGFVSTCLENWGVTRMQWLLLASAASESKSVYGHTMGELAECLDIQLSQLTALASSLNLEGLLDIAVSPTDRRIKYVRISTRGKKLLRDIEKEMKETLKQWLADVDRGKLSVYMEVLEILGREK